MKQRHTLFTFFLSACLMSMFLFVHTSVSAQTPEPKPIRYGDKIFSTLDIPYEEEFQSSDLYVFTGTAGDTITIRYNHQVLSSLAGVELVMGNVTLINLTTNEQIMGGNTLETFGFVSESYAITHTLPDTGPYGIVVFLAGLNENPFYSRARYDLALTSLNSNLITAGEIADELAVGQAKIWQYQGTVGEQIRITTVADWDTTLAIYPLGSQREVAANDDDASLPNRNSRITVTLPETGFYQIHVGSHENGLGGAYRLIVESGAENLVAPGVELIRSNAGWTPVERDFNGIPMVLVPPGCFTLGLTYEQISAAMDRFETPMSTLTEREISSLTRRFGAHLVCIAEAFWIDKTEVWQSVFRDMGGNKTNRNQFTGDNLPVENITWFEAKRFCELRGMRLPTEPEWEYAAAGPDNLTYPWGNDFDGDRITWLENSGQRTDDVGTNPTNASWVGALDMSGNVSEWVSSMAKDYPYDASDGRENPTDRFEFRTMRGGSWAEGYLDNLRTEMRFRAGPLAVMDHVGFRCVQAADLASLNAGPDAEPEIVRTPDPIPSVRSARMDFNGGDLAVGATDTWEFEGQAGDALTVTVLADWDTTLTILRNGAQIAYNDDDDSLPNYNSRLTITLPADGTYDIVVGSYEDRFGGVYALVIEPAETQDTGTTSESPAEPVIALPDADFTDDPRIVYISSDNRIATVATDGTDVQFLTEPGEYRSPRWSPNGALIAFYDRVREAYMVMNRDGSDVSELVSCTYICPGLTWSPDGTQVAYIVSDGMSETEIHIFSLATGATTIIAPRAYGYSYTRPEWSPDGNFIAFTLIDGGAEYLAFAEPLNNTAFRTSYASESGSFRNGIYWTNDSQFVMLRFDFMDVVRLFSPVSSIRPSDVAVSSSIQGHAVRYDADGSILFFNDFEGSYFTLTSATGDVLETVRIDGHSPHWP